jgi:uncharacterized protein YebE (UPF0316 family)
MLPQNLFLACLVVFALRIADVSLGTLRTVFIMQGRRWRATFTGFVEVTIWIFVVSQIVAAISDWVLMLAYAAGFAAGTWVGLWLEQHFAMGFVQLRIISRDRGRTIAENLWARSFGATIVEGHGREGLVSLIFSIVPRRHLSESMEIATQTDPQSFIAISDSRSLLRGYHGQHLRK